MSVPGIAGQFTFTNGPLPHGESSWMRRVMISFPVPLSPWIRMGILAAATFSRRCWTASMLGHRPKMTNSGGRLILGLERAMLVAEAVDIIDYQQVSGEFSGGSLLYTRICILAANFCS